MDSFPVGLFRCLFCYVRDFKEELRLKVSENWVSLGTCGYKGGGERERETVMVGNARFKKT